MSCTGPPEAPDLHQPNVNWRCRGQVDKLAAKDSPLWAVLMSFSDDADETQAPCSQTPVSR